MLTRLEPLWLNLAPALATVAGLGFLVFVHELGHFLAAKRAGVRVEVFSLGVGHFLLSWRRGDTVYALSWLPLGGYVRMSGQQDLAAPSDRPAHPWDYRAKRPAVRMAVIGAGVAMNLVAGYLCFTASFLWGRQDQPPVVGRLDARDWQTREALDAGLRQGDRVLAVNGDPVFSFVEMNMRVMRERPGSLVEFTVRRAAGGEPEKVLLKTYQGRHRGLATSVPTAAQPEAEVSFRLGFSARRRLVVTPSAGVLAQPVFPGWSRLFRPGDEIESAGGVESPTEEDMTRLFRESGGGPLELSVRGRSGRRRRVRLPVVPVYRVGIVAAGAGRSPLLVGQTAPDSPAAAAGIVPGDEIRLGEGARSCSLAEFSGKVQDSKGRPVEVTVIRPGGTRRRLSLRPSAEEWHPDPGGEGKLPRGCPWGDALVVEEVAPGSSAEAKGLGPGAIISGLEIGRRADPGKPVTLTWTFQGRRRGPHRIGPFPQGPAVSLSLPRIELIRLPLGRALAAGWAETSEALEATTAVFRKLMGREVGTGVLSGPVGIVQMAYRSAREGTGHLLWLLGLLGMSLAFINLLPIPVLDGGHLVFLAYEAVRRRPPPPRVVELAQYVGTLIILGLFLLVFYNDLLGRLL